MKALILDTSFLVDLENETSANIDGPATRTLEKLKGCRLFVTPVTVAEILEGSVDPLTAARELSAYRAHTIGWAAAHRCALNQSRAPRRMGENDAWQGALAAIGDHQLVGHDRAFDGRSWLDYLDHRKS
ncbi:MAG: type II toxin-antitoxin system VapC family toxin [Opitutaceae bacterium]